MPKKFRDVSNEESFVKAKVCDSERSPNKEVTIDTVKMSSAEESKGNVTRHHCCWHYIENITCPRVDMNFIFEWSTRYIEISS